MQITWKKAKYAKARNALMKAYYVGSAGTDIALITTKVRTSLHGDNSKATHPSSTLSAAFLLGGNMGHTSRTALAAGPLV